MRARKAVIATLLVGVLAAPAVVNAQTSGGPTQAEALAGLDVARAYIQAHPDTTTTTVPATTTTVAPTTTTSTTVAPTTTTLPATTTTSPPAGTVGQCCGGVAYPIGQISDHVRHAAALAAAGFSWVRSDASIKAAMPTATTRNWPALWSWIDPYAAKGIKVNVIWYLLPSWMNGSSDDKVAPTSDKVYADAAAEAAPLLYQHGVRAMELWNEANWGFWKPTPDRDRYVKFAKAAAAAIRAAEPRMLVISTGVSTADTEYNAGTHKTVNRFDTGASYTSNELGADQTLDIYGALGLFAAKDASGRPLIDGVGIHPYLDGVVPDPVGTSPEWMRWQGGSLRHILAILDRWGGTTTKVWNTESAAPRSAMTADEQARRASLAYHAFNDWTLSNGAKMRARLGPYFWFTYVDWTLNQPAREASFGLVTGSYVDHPARPAVSAVLDDSLAA